MARLVGLGVWAVQFFLVLTIIYNQFIPSDSVIYSGTQQDHHGHKETTQLYSYRTIVNFNGFCFVSPPRGMMPGLRASSRSSEGTLVTTSNTDRRHSTSTKFDTITCILINMLARSGDVQPNPGPSTKCIKGNIIKPNSTSAINCDQCLSLTRFRRYL